MTETQAADHRFTTAELIPVDSGSILVVDQCHIPADLLEDLVNSGTAEIVRTPGGDGFFNADIYSSIGPDGELVNRSGVSELLPAPSGGARIIPGCAEITNAHGIEIQVRRRLVDSEWREIPYGEITNDKEFEATVRMLIRVAGYRATAAGRGELSKAYYASTMGDWWWDIPYAPEDRDWLETAAAALDRLDPSIALAYIEARKPTEWADGSGE